MTAIREVRSPSFLRLAFACGAALALLASPSLAQQEAGETPGVPSANARAAGVAPADRLTSRLAGERVQAVELVRGSVEVENPSPTAGGLLVSHFGYLNDGPELPAMGSNL